MSRSILIYDMNRFFPLVFKQVSPSRLFHFLQPYYSICFFGNKILAPQKTSKTWKIQNVTSFCKEQQITVLMVVSESFLHYFTSCAKQLTLILQNLFLLTQNIIPCCLDELKCEDLEINNKSVTLNSTRIFPFQSPAGGGGGGATIK